MIVSTSGFFFYLTIVRQDMLDKLLVVDSYRLPSLCAVKVMAKTGGEDEVVGGLVQKNPSSANVFYWCGILDSLVGRIFPCLAGEPLSTTGTGGSSEVQWSVGGGLVLLDGKLGSVIEIGRWFSSFFFLWFRGLYKCTREEMNGLIVEFMRYRPMGLVARDRVISFWLKNMEDYLVLPSVVSRVEVRLCVTFLFNSSEMYYCGEQACRVFLGGFRLIQRALP